MDDIDFASNPDSLDGDFKALLAMRQRHQSERTEEEENVIAKSVQKFLDLRRQNSSLAEQLPQNVTDVNEVDNKRQTVDYDQISAAAFQAVDDADFSKLEATVAEVILQQGDLGMVKQPKTEETLLHRALDREVANAKIVEYIIETFSEGYVCTSEQTIVGGKKSKKTTLHIAAERGHMEAAKLLVNKISDLKRRDKFLHITTVIVPEGQRPRPLTCLHIAAKAGNNDLVTFFIKHCEMTVNLANDKGDLPILWAANDNKPSTVELLIKLGADVNGQNDKGSSALHWACRNGHTDVVKILLSKSEDIDVNIKRRLGLVCPIIAASAMGFTEIVKLLIDHRADINIRMKSGHTALHFAAVEGHLDIVMQLLNAGASIDLVDDQGNDALLLAASHGQHVVVVFLAKCGSSFSHINHAGKTVWDIALEQKNAKLMMALVHHVTSSGTSANQQLSSTNNGFSHNELKDQQTRMSVLSTMSPSAKLVLPPGITPLHAAATIGDNEIIKFLIDMNLDPFGTDDDESTFIHVAAKHNQSETLKKFATETLCRAQDSRGYTALHVACELACNEAVAILLPISNLSLTNIHNQTALHLATRSVNVALYNTKALVTQMILHHDWTVLHVQDIHKRSALHSAVLAGNCAVIPELHHLSPNVLDINGATPLHSAIVNGDHDMLNQLVKTFSAVGRTIDLNMLDANGDSPLHLAARNCRAKMAKTLIKCGANLINPNSRGRSVLHELAWLVFENRAEELSYMQVFESIRQSCIHWWCRRIGRSVPNELADDHVEYKKRAVLHLFTNVYEADGYSVLQYAARLGAKDMVIEILNTPHAFRITNPQSSDVSYDVSDLLPFTSTHENREAQRKHSSKGKSSVTPSNDSESPPPADQTGASSMSVAELLVKVDAQNEVASILDASPFKNIVDSYWGAYQRLFLMSFLFHVLVMSVYSYLGLAVLDCSSTSSNSTSLSSGSMVARTWYVELGLVFTLIWPLCLLVYDMLKVIKWIRSCAQVGITLTSHNIKSQSEYLAGFVILQLCGFFYSTLTIVWYAMNRLCIPHQDYLLATSYLFGWVYAINFTRGFKQIHHFSIILQHILFRDMLKFALIYLFILLAFSFAYGALVQAIPSLKISGSDAIFLVFNWMIGMADFDTVSSEFSSANKSEAMVEIVYAVYIILSTIVLLNLLIAMMSDSYAHVKKMSEAMWKVGSLRLPLELEEGIGRSLYHPKHLTYDVDAKRWFFVIPKRDLVEKESSSAAVIHDLTVKIERLMEESRVRESRVLSLLEVKGSGATD